MRSCTGASVDRQRRSLPLWGRAGWGAQRPQKEDRRPAEMAERRHIEVEPLAALSRLRRPDVRPGLGLSTLLAGPLLAGLATLLPRPLLGLRLPALLAVPLLALAHQLPPAE